MQNFIPKQYKKEVISLRIDSEKVRNLERLAQENHISRNEFIVQCIDYALQHLQEDGTALEPEA